MISQTSVPPEASPSSPAPRPKKGQGSKAWGWMGLLLGAAALVFFVESFLIFPIRVEGGSMRDTLRDGEVLLASPLPYALGEMRRGDSVICRYPGRTEGSLPLAAALGLTRHTLFVKRLVALPGDTLEIHGGRLYVNGALTADPPAMASTPRELARRTLGPDEYFVMGDNRFSSLDSRAEGVGPLHRTDLVAKVLLAVWPLSSVRAIH